MKALTNAYTFYGLAPVITEDNDRVIFTYNLLNRHIAIEVSDELIYERGTHKAIKNRVTEWLND